MIASDTEVSIEGFTEPKKLLKVLYSQADGKNKQKRYQVKYRRQQTQKQQNKKDKIACTVILFIKLIVISIKYAFFFLNRKIFVGMS